MLKRIEGIDGVESIVDVLMKIDPNKVIDQKIKVLQDEKKVNQEQDKRAKMGGPREEAELKGWTQARVLLLQLNLGLT